MDIEVFPIIGGAERTRIVYLRPATPAIVGMLMKNSPAERAELKEGDEILTMAGSEIISVEQISEYVGKVDETPIEFTIRRDGNVITKTIQPVSIQINPQGEYAPMLGIRWMPGTTTLRENPFTQLKNVIHLTFTTLERLFHPGSDIGIRHLSGPLGIGTLIFQFALAEFSLRSLDRGHNKRQFGHSQFIAHTRAGRGTYSVGQSGEVAGETHAAKPARQLAKRFPAFTAFPDGLRHHFRRVAHLPLSIGRSRILQFRIFIPRPRINHGPLLRFEILHHPTEYLGGQNRKCGSWGR